MCYMFALWWLRIQKSSHIRHLVCSMRGVLLIMMCGSRESHVSQKLCACTGQLSLLRKQAYEFLIYFLNDW